MAVAAGQRHIAWVAPRTGAADITLARKDDLDLDAVQMTTRTFALRAHTRMVAAGRWHGAAVDEDGQLYTWGDAGYGQLARLVEPSFSDWTPTAVQLGLKVCMVACGNCHTVLLVDGKVLTCGNNVQGELGLGSVTMALVPSEVRHRERVAFIAAGGLRTMAITADGVAHGWGDRMNQGENAYFTREISSLEQHGQAVFCACGPSHCALVNSDGAVFCWGSALWGRLGVIDHTDRKVPTQVMSEVMPPVRMVSCGLTHTLAVDTHGVLWGWGCMVMRTTQEMLREMFDVPARILPDVFGNDSVASVSSAFERVAVVTGRGRLFTFGQQAAVFPCSIQTTRIGRVNLWSGRAGNWLVQNPESTIAFLLGTHARVGKDSPLHTLPEEAVAIVLMFVLSVVEVHPCVRRYFPPSRSPRQAFDEMWARAVEV